MAKNNGAEKKEFAWDSEVGIGNYDASEKERHVVSVCILKGTQFLVDTKMVLKSATGWTPVKNTSIRLDNMEKLMEIFSNWKLTDAFGSGGAISINVGAPEGKPKRKAK